MTCVDLGTATQLCMHTQERRGFSCHRTMAKVECDSVQEPAEEGASPAFSLIENSAYDQDGTGATRPSTAGSREDARSAADKEGQSSGLHCHFKHHLFWSLSACVRDCCRLQACGQSQVISYGALQTVEHTHGDAGMATAEKAEADFHFSSLKRKWHAEEGKYLAHELRRAQDLNVQQEMELESLRQQVAALSSVCSEACSYAPLCCNTVTFAILCLHVFNVSCFLLM